MKKTKKAKLVKTEDIRDIGSYTLQRKTYEIDDSGDKKIRIMPPIKIKLDKKK